MKLNDLIGKIELRIKELGKLSMPRLRMEHPDYAVMLKGKNKTDIIAEIIVEEFSSEYEIEIDS